MNTLHSALQDYLALRRGLGYKMNDAGRLLPRFVSFLETRHEPHITAQSALQWAQQAEVQPAEWARRLGFVRGFARYSGSPERRRRPESGSSAPRRGIANCQARRLRCTMLSRRNWVTEFIGYVLRRGLSDDPDSVFDTAGALYPEWSDLDPGIAADSAFSPDGLEAR